MRKHLIGTILVLAALAACNKEVETSVVDNGQPEDKTGKVTLTFKATISEETRTIYDNDKTASWEAGDAITVCVTDGTNYETADFTTTDGETFSGEVTDGYTTIVSAIYPANDNYREFQEDYFTDGAVTAVFLPHAYNLEDSNDTGKFIPLVSSSIDGETMTFHHFCSAMKVTLTNIPQDATLFTFTTNKQQITTDFTLNDGRIGLINQDDGTNTAVSFRFEAGSLDTRSFYIPIPDGSLAANSYVTLQNDDDDLLYKKIITSSPTFGLNTNGKDAIRVLPAVACWTKNEDWNAYYFGSFKSSGVIYKRISLENMTGSYQYEVLSSTTFNNTYGGSVVNYLSSAHFGEYVSGLTKSYSTETKNIDYPSLSKGTKYVIVFGLDDELHFTGEYNCIEVVYPSFSTPDGWSISVVESDSYPIKYTVPAGTKWQNVTVSATTFADFFLGDVEFLVYYYARDYKGQYDADPSKYAPRTGNVNFKAPANPEGKEYVFVSFGIDENYRATGEYCKLDYTFEPPTETYSAWIGKWSLSNGDTWTVSSKQANHTYVVKGLCGTSSFTAEAELTEDGHLLFKTQKGVGKQTYNGYDVTVNLYKRKTSSGGFSSTIGNLMQATMDGEGQAATLAPTNAEYPIYSMVGSYKDANGDTKYVGYGSNRSAADVTLTRVTE